MVAVKPRGNRIQNRGVKGTACPLLDDDGFACGIAQGIARFRRIEQKRLAAEQRGFFLLIGQRSRIPAGVKAALPKGAVADGNQVGERSGAQGNRPGAACGRIVNRLAVKFCLEAAQTVISEQRRLGGDKQRQRNALGSQIRMGRFQQAAAQAPGTKIRVGAHGINIPCVIIDTVLTYCNRQEIQHGNRGALKKRHHCVLGHKPIVKKQIDISLDIAKNRLPKLFKRGRHRGGRLCEGKCSLFHHFSEAT
ncbi:hypothetical protein SDC9_147562 [bioreactor metagenome]|uniref:Uncharacterized protein n=1 Tax=bioreactor metagenome TaxID=1076179 RepID=A0A645EED3_9ZZZZ